MRIHSDYLTVQTKQKREFMNITPNVKDAAEKSGIRDGLILISSLHSNSGIFDQRRRARPPAGHRRMGRSAGAARDRLPSSSRAARAMPARTCKALLLNHQAIVSLADGKLELGPWQQVIFAELDGQRPKRILIKVLGE